MDSQGETVPERNQVRRRNQKACDACRGRKVKCLYDGPVCRACVELQVPCTQNKPRRRRGPPNGYAATLGRKSVSLHSTSPTSPPTTSDSPNPTALDALAQLAPPAVIRAIIDDWFELIHCVAPILHRGQFLGRLENGDAAQDPEFCCLVISVCAATVTSLRRKASTNYGTVNFEKCREVINRNNLLQRKSRFTLEWCQTNYGLGVTCAAERGLDDITSFQYMSDAVMGVKYMVYYELPHMPFLSQQLLKRLYWMIFAAQSSGETFGRPHISLMSTMDNIESLRPLDITDRELDPTHESPQDCWQCYGITYIPGLNHLSNLFLIWNSSQQANNRSLAELQRHIDLTQRALDSLPTELRWRGGLSRPPRSNFGTDVQIANLYITQLHIRSNLLEQSHRLAKAENQELTSQQILSERQSIVDDLLEILYHMPRETLEANGHSLVPKIRDIGSALLDDVRMGESPGEVTGKAKDDLMRLLDKLDKLDFRPSSFLGSELQRNELAQSA